MSYIGKGLILMGRYELYSSNRIGLLREIAIAFLVQVLPIIIFRFLIKKTDIKKSTASIASIVSFFVTVAMLILLGQKHFIPYTFILAFSFLDYWFLTIKKPDPLQTKMESATISDAKEHEIKHEINEKDLIANPAMTNTTDGSSYNATQPTVFCRRCGNRIESDSLYCSFCGEKTILALESEDHDVQ